MGAPQYEQAGADIGGTGTTNTIPRWTGPSTLGDSVLVQVGAGIGLGTSTLYTGTKLQVSGSGGVAAITSEDTNAGGNFLRWLADTTNQPLINWTTGSALRFATSTSAFGTFAEWMRITGTGNVGIGTTSPAFKLEVAAGTASAMRLVSDSGTATVLRLLQTANRDWGIRIPASSTSLSFYDYSAGQERMVIDLNGNVGIATATPLSYANYVSLTIGGNDAAKTGILKFRSTYNGGNGAEIFQSTAGVLAISANGSRSIMSAQNTGATDSAAQVAIGTSSFTSGCSLTVAQSIDVSQSAQGLKLQGTGGTNNTDPNVLDFYADGGTANSGGVAWTPTLKFGGNTTGITYNTQMGRYTRIGNMVFASCYIRLTSKGTATGAATIDGLPTCVNLAGFYAAGAIGYTAAITSTGTMQINMLANQTQLTIRQVTAVGVNTAVTDTDFANGSEIIVSISYPVN